MKRRFLPIEALPAWTRLNGVSFDGIEVRRLQTDDGVDKGSSVIATRSRPAKQRVLETGKVDEPEILMRIPADLVLSSELVETYAKSDRYLREVLDTVGEFGKVG